MWSTHHVTGLFHVAMHVHACTNEVTIEWYRTVHTYIRTRRWLRTIIVSGLKS